MPSTVKFLILVGLMFSLFGQASLYAAKRNTLTPTAADLWLLGDWETNWGVVTFKRTWDEDNYYHLGHGAYGVYTDDNGRIVDLVWQDENILSALWSEDMSNEECPHSADNGRMHWGYMKLTFTTDAFTGSWGYCSNSTNGGRPFLGKRSVATGKTFPDAPSTPQTIPANPLRTAPTPPAPAKPKTDGSGNVLAGGIGGETFSGNMGKTDLKVTHKIHMPINGTLTIEIKTGPNQNIEGFTLRDSDNKTSLGGGGRIGNDGVSKDFSFLRAGTYYLELRKDSRTFYYGPYTVNTRITGQTFANDSEPNDTFETAGQLNLGAAVTGHLGARGQQKDTDLLDYWKLTVPSDGVLELDVTTSEKLLLRFEGGVFIFGNDREYEVYSERHYSDTNKVHRKVNIGAGTYYILMGKDHRGSYWGSYQIRASLTPVPVENDKEVNDDYAHANKINSASITGHLGYYSGRDPGRYDREDWYQIMVPNPATVNFDLTTSEELNIYGRFAVYAGDGTTRLYSERQSPNETVRHSVKLEPGKYYLLVEKDERSSYWGWYTLRISGANLSSATQTIPPAKESLPKKGTAIAKSPGVAGVLVDNQNTGGCGFTDIIRFSLPEKITISEFSTWINWPNGVSTVDYKVSRGGSQFHQGRVQRGSCDSFQRSWCKGIDTWNKTFDAGDYVIKTGLKRVCQNSGSQGNGYITLQTTGSKGPGKASSGKPRQSGDDHDPARASASTVASITSGKTLFGEAHQDLKRWPFELRITNYDSSTGGIVGNLTWQTLNSVHRIRGTLAGKRLEFTEVEAIRRGAAHLNVYYEITLSGYSGQGTWVDLGDKSWGAVSLATSTSLLAADDTATKSVGTEIATPGTYEEAIKAYLAKNYARAYALLLPLADAGDRRALYSLALMYHRGQGITQDSRKAYAMFQLAKARGSRRAQSYLDSISASIGREGVAIGDALAARYTPGNLPELLNTGTQAVAGGPLASPTDNMGLPADPNEPGNQSKPQKPVTRPGNGGAGVTPVSGNGRVAGPNDPVPGLLDPCNKDMFSGLPTLWVQKPNDYIYDPAADPQFDVDMGNYDEAVSEAMQGMRQVAPPQTAEQLAQFEALWAPMFDYPSPKGMVYLDKLNPLQEVFLGLIASAEAFLAGLEIAWYEAEMAAAYESEQGAAEAMAVVMYIAEQLEHVHSDIVQVQEKIQALGGPPNPMAEKCKAQQRTKAAMDLFQQEEQEHSCAAYWRGDVKAGAGRLGLLAAMDMQECDLNFTGMAISCGDRQCTEDEEEKNRAKWKKSQRDLKIAYREWSIKEGRGDPGLNGAASGSEESVAGQGLLAKTGEQEAQAQAQELQEKVDYHTSNIKWLEKTIRRAEDQLSKVDPTKDKDGRQRRMIESEIIAKRADLQGQHDAITTARTGQFTHTRTSWDELNHLGMLEQAAERREKFDGTARMRTSIERMITLLDPAEQYEMRQWVRKQILEKPSDKENLKKVGQVIHNKLLGYANRQQAESIVEEDNAAWMSDVAQGFQTLATPALLIGGAVAGAVAAPAIAGVVTGGMVTMGYGLASGAISGYLYGSSMDRLRKDLDEEYGRDRSQVDRTKTDAGNQGMLIEGIVGAASYIHPVIYYSVSGLQAFYQRETVKDPKTGKVTTQRAGIQGAGKELVKLILTQKIIGVATGATRGYFQRGQALQKQARLDSWKDNKRSQDFQQERAAGKALAQDVTRRYMKFKGLKASAGPKQDIARAEQHLLDGIAAVKMSQHAKGYLKFNASAREKRAYNFGDNIHTDIVVKEFKLELTRQGYDVNKLVFTQYRNKGNTSVGMDMDLGVQPRSGIRVTQRDPKTGAVVKVRPLDDANKAFQKIFDGVYKKHSGGRSAELSFQTITSSAHVEAYIDLGWINLKGIPDPRSHVRYRHVEQAAKVTQYKAYHLNKLRITEVNRNWEAMRGAAKDIRTKLLPFIDTQIPKTVPWKRKAMVSKREYFENLTKALELANHDPVRAEKALMSLTGRTFPEVLKMTTATIEMAGKFGR